MILGNDYSILGIIVTYSNNIWFWEFCLKLLIITVLRILLCRWDCRSHLHLMMQLSVQQTNAFFWNTNISNSNGCKFILIDSGTPCVFTIKLIEIANEFRKKFMKPSAKFIETRVRWLNLMEMSYFELLSTGATFAESRWRFAAGESINSRCQYEVNNRRFQCWKGK